LSRGQEGQRALRKAWPNVGLRVFVEDHPRIDQSSQKFKQNEEFLPDLDGFTATNAGAFRYSASIKPKYLPNRAGDCRFLD